MSKQSLSIRIDDYDINRIKSLLGELANKTPVVLSRSINRTITNVKKNMAMGASKEYYVTSTVAKKTIRISKATKSKLVATATSESPTIALAKFKVSPNRTVSYSRSKRKPNPPFYRAGTKRNEPLKAFGSNPKAFIAVMKSGHVGFFVRLNDQQMAAKHVGNTDRGSSRKVKRNAIKQLFGPSVAQMIGNEKIIDKVQTEASTTLHKRIDAEINLIIGGRNG